MAELPTVTVQVVAPIEPSVWCVVTWLDNSLERRTYIDDRSLAEAYAAAHRGQLVPLAALVPWPIAPLRRCAGESSQQQAKTSI